MGALTLPAESVKTCSPTVIRAGSTGAPTTCSARTRRGQVERRPAAHPGALRRAAEQLKSPGSFAWQLKKMLRVRAKYRINESEQVDVPAVKARPGRHGPPAPDGQGTQVTAINFGRVPSTRRWPSRPRRPAAVTDLLEDKALGTLARRATAARPRSPRGAGPAHQVVRGGPEDGRRRPLVNGSAEASRPHLSFWQIWNMSFGFLGIQFGWALQMANVSAIYEYLGADAHQIPILWLAAPLTGLVVQPIIGHMSDHTGTGWAGVAPTSSWARCSPPSRSSPCPTRRRCGWRRAALGDGRLHQHQHGAIPRLRR